MSGIPILRVQVRSPTVLLDGYLTSVIAKKEAKRLEREAKLAAKTSKVAAATPAGEKKVKVEKEKKEEEPAFVNTTPKGEKKGDSLGTRCCYVLTL